MSRPRPPVVTGLGRGVGVSTVSRGLHARELPACRPGDRADADIVVCAGDGLAAAATLILPADGPGPVLAVRVHDREPSGSRLRALEGRFGAVVALPHVERWAGLTVPSPEVVGLLGRPAERLPAPLRDYAVALREIAAAVLRSGRLTQPVPSAVLWPRPLELWRGLWPVERAAPDPDPDDPDPFHGEDDDAVEGSVLLASSRDR